MGNHEFCIKCGESDFHIGRACEPGTIEQYRSRGTMGSVPAHKLGMAQGGGESRPTLLITDAAIDAVAKALFFYPGHYEDKTWNLASKCNKQSWRDRATAALHAAISITELAERSMGVPEHLVIRYDRSVLDRMASHVQAIFAEWLEAGRGPQIDDDASMWREDMRKLAAMVCDSIAQNLQIHSAPAPSAAATQAATIAFGIIVENMPLAEFRSRIAAALQAAYAVDKSQAMLER